MHMKGGLLRFCIWVGALHPHFFPSSLAILIEAALRKRMPLAGGMGQVYVGRG